MELEVDALLLNHGGIHARPATALIDLIREAEFRYSVEIWATNVGHDYKPIIPPTTLRCESSIDLMMLVAYQGCIVRFRICGQHPKSAAAAIVDLVASGFHACIEDSEYEKFVRNRREPPHALMSEYLKLKYPDKYKGS